MPTATYVHSGDAIEHIPAIDLAVGDVVVLGQLVGIATHPIPAGRLGSLALTGVFGLPVTVGTVAGTGTVAFWNPATGEVTNDGAIPGVVRCGLFAQDVVAVDTQARILLGR